MYKKLSGSRTTNNKENEGVKSNIMTSDPRLIPPAMNDLQKARTQHIFETDPNNKQSHTPYVKSLHESMFNESSKPNQSVLNLRQIKPNSARLLQKNTQVIVQKPMKKISTPITRLEEPLLVTREDHVDDYYSQTLTYTPEGLLLFATGRELMIANTVPGPEGENLRLLSNNPVYTSLSCNNVFNTGGTITGHCIRTYRATSQILFDLAFGENTQKPHLNRITSLCDKNDYELFVAAHQHKTIHFMDCRMHTPVQHFNIDNPILNIQYNKVQDKIAVSCDSLADDKEAMVNIYDVRKMESPVNILFHGKKGGTKAISFSPFDSELLAIGGSNDDCRLQIWNYKTQTCIESVDTNRQIPNVGWINPNTVFTTFGYERANGNPRYDLINLPTVGIWQLDKKTSKIESKQEYFGHTRGPTFFAALNPKKNQLATASIITGTSVWDINAEPVVEPIKLRGIR